MLDVISFAKAQSSMGADVIQDVDITALNTAIGMPYSNNDSLSTRVTTLEGKTFLPNVTSTDNDKVLMVDNAAWSVQSLPTNTPPSSIIWLEETWSADEQNNYYTINLTYNDLLNMINDGQMPVLCHNTIIDEIPVKQVYLLCQFGYDEDADIATVTFMDIMQDAYNYLAIGADVNLSYTAPINPK